MMLTQWSLDQNLVSQVVQGMSTTFRKGIFLAERKIFLGLYASGILP